MLIKSIKLTKLNICNGMIFPQDTASDFSPSLIKAHLKSEASSYGKASLFLH